jgi:hypothetical protein
VVPYYNSFQYLIYLKYRALGNPWPLRLSICHRLLNLLRRRYIPLSLSLLALCVQSARPVPGPDAAAFESELWVKGVGEDYEERGEGRY